MKQKLLTVFFSLILIAVFIPINAAYAALPDGVPGSVAQATLNKIEVKNDESGMPYFQVEIQVPQSYLDLNTDRPADGNPWIEYYWQIDDGSWEMVYSGIADSLLDEDNMVPGKTNTYYDIVDPIAEGTAEAIEIKDHTYTIRAKLFYQYYYGEGGSQFDFISSDYSNEVSIGSGSFYQKATEWAKPELQKAYDLGLIPDILNGADMTEPITREEFCELAILLYENITGLSSEPVSPNPFKDTSNPQILKAFKLGITTGTSDTAFSPNVLINREQCAAMLFRTIKATNPEGDYNITGVKDFPDQKNISSWAIEATKYMSKTGIITGDAQGNYMPKATTTAQKAAGYGMATREQAIAMTVRTLEKLND